MLGDLRCFPAASVFRGAVRADKPCWGEIWPCAPNLQYERWLRRFRSGRRPTDLPGTAYLPIRPRRSPRHPAIYMPPVLRRMPPSVLRNFSAAMTLLRRRIPPPKRLEKLDGIQENPGDRCGG